MFRRSRNANYRSGKKNMETINKQINKIETFFKNHFRMDSEMVLDQNTYFEISTQISEVNYICYTPSKQYIRTINDIPEIYVLFQQQVNNIKSFFPNITFIEYNSLAEIPEVENTIVLLYNIQQNLYRSEKVCYVYFYYDDIVFSTDYISDKKILKSKEIDENHIYLCINFPKTKLNNENMRSREKYDLVHARRSILYYYMFGKKKKEFKCIENESADLIIGEIQFILNSDKRNIYLFFFQDLGKQAGSQINEEFLKICETFNSVERINIIYCPLIGITKMSSISRASAFHYYLPYSNTEYYDKNISQAISHIKEQIRIKMQTTEKNTSYNFKLYSSVSSILNYNKQTEIKNNICVAPFFYESLVNVICYYFFENSIVQLRSYLPCKELDIKEIDYDNISSYIHTFQVYKIFLMKYNQQLSKSCKCFHAYLSRLLGNDQKKNLNLKIMSSIINRMPNTIIDNIPNIIEDVHNIALNYLNSDFGCQNINTSNRNDLYITVYKELEQDQNVL